VKRRAKVPEAVACPFDSGYPRWFSKSHLCSNKIVVRRERRGRKSLPVSPRLVICGFESLFPWGERWQFVSRNLPPTEVEKPSVLTRESSWFTCGSEGVTETEPSSPPHKASFLVSREEGEREGDGRKRPSPQKSTSPSLPVEEAEGQPVDSDEPKAFTIETGKRKNGA
jgi:hypothetical protein